MTRLLLLLLIPLLTACESIPSIREAHRLEAIAFKLSKQHGRERYAAALEDLRAEKRRSAMRDFQYHVLLRRDQAGRVAAGDVVELLRGKELRGPDGKPVPGPDGKPKRSPGLAQALDAIDEKIRAELAKWDAEDPARQDFRDLHEAVQEYLDRRGISAETQNKLTGQAAVIGDRLTRRKEK